MIRRTFLPALLSALVAIAVTLASCAWAAPTEDVDELNFYNTDLHLVLKALSEKTGYPFVEDIPVEGKVTIHVSKRTLVGEVLDQMLRGLNLSWRLERGVYHVGLKLPVKGTPLGKGLLARTYPLENVPADEAADSLRQVLSDFGKVTVDPGMNTVTVTDVAEIHNSVKSMLDSLDVEGKRPAQINVQIKVLQIDRNSDWGAGATVNWNKYDAFEGLASEYVLPVATDNRDTGNEGGNFSPDSLTFKIGHFGIDDFVARYQYLSGNPTNSRSGVRRVDILAEPDVTVPSEKEAKITVGEKLPRTVGSNFDYRDTGIIMTVKPTLLSEGRILLEIKPVQIIDLSGWRRSGLEILTTREVTTKVEVASGGTIRIGGIIYTEDSDTENKIPVLGDLPLLGYFFKWKSVSKTKQEVVILVSPRLLERIPPRCASTPGISALTASLIAGTSNVMLDWSEDVPFDNVGVVRYHVYRDIRPIVGTLGLVPLSREVRGDATSWVDYAPKRRGVTYYYAVTGLDGAGNEQTVSNSPSIAIPRR
jgi:type II secretory pathway component GspD/PulD (secretin)